MPYTWRVWCCYIYMVCGCVLKRAGWVAEWPPALQCAVASAAQANCLCAMQIRDLGLTSVSPMSELSGRPPHAAVATERSSGLARGPCAVHHATGERNPITPNRSAATHTPVSRTLWPLATQPLRYTEPPFRSLQQALPNSPSYSSKTSRPYSSPGGTRVRIRVRGWVRVRGFDRTARASVVLSGACVDHLEGQEYRGGTRNGLDQGFGILPGHGRKLAHPAHDFVVKR